MEYDTINLAPDEWGNETMRQIAEEHFAKFPDVQFVEVHEHGGWWLGYRRDGSIWSTANDAAALDSKARPTHFSGRNVRREKQQAAVA